MLKKLFAGLRKTGKITEKNLKKPEDKIPRDLLMLAWILVLGAIAPMLDSTMTNIAVNSLSSDFHTTLSVVQWVMTGYVLATGVVVPLSGWLTKRFDGKKVFLLAEVGFLITSLLCGISWSVESLIVFRLFQGATCGILIPLLMNLIMAKAPHDQLGRLMATVSLPMTLGPILGPVLGGFIVQYLNWHWMFFVNIFFAAIAIPVIAWKLPKFPALDKKAKLDYAGLGMLAALSFAFIYGIVEAGQHANFTNSTTLIWCGIGAVFLIAYIIYAKIVRNKALLPLNLFKHKSFSASSVGLFLCGMATNGPMLILPMLFQNVRGLSVIGAALMLLPQGIGMLIARPIVGKMVDKIGAKWVTIISVVITLVGTLPFLWVDGGTATWWILAVLLVRGFGVGGIIMPIMTDAYTGLDKESVPAATTGTRIIQNIGGAFGSAVLSTVIASMLLTTHNLVDSYQRGFLWAMILGAVIIVPAMFLTNKMAKKVSKRSAKKVAG
jgi:EmrB/QacA subfamily drug resistance transporter